MRHRTRREDPAPRAQQKQQTRQALLDAALRLVADKSFDSVSLREVTREVGIVPTAFYRHFDSMDELGLVLVDETFRTARRLMRAAREGEIPAEQRIRRSAGTLVHYVQAHRPYFQFLIRERFGGVAVIRSSIRSEIRLFQSELATDLARTSELTHFDTADLQTLAGLLVTSMIAITEQVVETFTEQVVELPPRGEGLDEVARLAEKSLRLILLGASVWKSKRDPMPPID